LKRIKDSLWAILGQREPTAAPQEVVEAVRAAMLSALEGHAEKEHMALEMTLRFAKDLGELWYLRPELMRAIAMHSDEVVARKTLEGITAMFGTAF